jgi:hypothetical protein
MVVAMLGQFSGVPIGLAGGAMRLRQRTVPPTARAVCLFHTEIPPIYQGTFIICLFLVFVKVPFVYADKTPFAFYLSVTVKNKAAPDSKETLPHMPAAVSRYFPSFGEQFPARMPHPEPCHTKNSCSLAWLANLYRRIASPRRRWRKPMLGPGRLYP